MPLLPLVAALAVAPPAAPRCDLDGPPAVTLGPNAAPIRIESFLDPASTQSWWAFLELRRLVSDHAGEVRAELSLVGRGGPRHPHAHRVRAFVTALAARGHVESALRVVARDGVERTHARLVDPAAHRALAQELGVKPTVIGDALRDRCARQEVDERTVRLLDDLGLDSGSMARLPVFVVEGQAFDDGPRLDRLRPEVGRVGLRLRQHQLPRPLGPPPPIEATSERMQRPALGGVLLGGPGLRHRFVLMARDEEDPTVAIMLPGVLKARREHPGSLAVHVVARGVSSGAERLRHRLCAARTLGLQAAYLDFLARDSLLRQSPHPVDELLLEALDEVPEPQCKGEVDPVDLDLPDGAWLDGMPRSRQEIELLETTLRLLDEAWRPLDPVLQPPPPEP